MGYTKEVIKAGKGDTPKKGATITVHCKRAVTAR